MARLIEEGFTTDVTEEDWKRYGETIFRRSEKISFTEGETIFIFTRVQGLNERILRQTSQAVVNSYSARSMSQKALSVLQSTTAYFAKREIESPRLNAEHLLAHALGLKRIQLYM